jgi:hypothetical protein
MMAWIDTYNIQPFVFEEFSRSPARLTTENFYQGKDIATWMRELPLDIGTANKHTYNGAANEPTFTILESSGVERKADVWFGAVNVTGVATWKITRIIASDPQMQAVLGSLGLSRSMIRGSFGETNSNLLAKSAQPAAPMTELDMAATCTPTVATHRR